MYDIKRQISHYGREKLVAFSLKKNQFVETDFW